MTDPEKLTHVRAEMALLEKTFAESVTEEAVILTLRADLKAVNEKLWEVEDEIRRCEKVIKLWRTVRRLGPFGLPS